MGGTRLYLKPKGNAANLEKIRAAFAMAGKIAARTTLNSASYDRVAGGSFKEFRRKCGRINMLFKILIWSCEHYRIAIFLTIKSSRRLLRNLENPAVLEAEIMRQILVELDKEMEINAPPIEQTFVELSSAETWSELLRVEMRRDPESKIRSRLIEVAKLAIAAVERIDESDMDDYADYPMRRSA